MKHVYKVLARRCLDIAVFITKDNECDGGDVYALLLIVTSFVTCIAWCMLLVGVGGHV